MSDLDRKQCFPSTWVETLALEYAKAHVMEAKTPVEFANLYIESINQIREALEKTYGKSKG